MTLKELLDRSDFRDIAPAIVERDPKMKESLHKFKESFDILRHITPEADAEDEDKVITISKCYDDDDNHEYYSVEPSCGVCSWESYLAKEIVPQEGVTLTDNEIAAHCLWELTYYGFDMSTDEGWRTAFKRMIGEKDGSNPYAVAADKLSDKLFFNYLPKYYSNGRFHNSLPKQLRNNKKLIPWDVEPRTCRNRSKRKRDYRQEQRIKKLERMAKVEDAIRGLCYDTASFKREELNYLFATKLIFDDTYQTRAYDVHRRMDYLFDLFSNYVFDDFSKYNRFMLMFRTSSDYPITQQEQDMIQNFFSQYLPSSAEIRYGYGNDNSLGTEVSLLLVGSY